MLNAELEEKALTRARNTAYRLLTYRARSRQELVGKLNERDFDPAVIDAVVDDLVRLGYLDDREFARQWAAGRARLRGFGMRRIDQELRDKGVSRDIIREALQTVFGESSEEEIARRETEKRLKVLGRFEPEVRRRRIAGFLERRGFPREIIYGILRSLR